MAALLRLSAQASVALAFGMPLGLTACDRAPSPGTDVREWTAADHDRAEEAQRQASGQQAPKSVAEARGSTRGDGGAARGNSEADAIATAVEITWRNQCAVCHGALGRGDGPNGALLHATNLTDPSFQSVRTDAELAAAIVNGKNRMPKFDFSPAIVAGLVGRIRASNGK